VKRWTSGSPWTLAMVKAMTIKPDDTRTFNQFDTINFQKLRAHAKESGVTPPIAMVKALGEAVAELECNKKLSKDRRGRRDLPVAVYVPRDTDRGGGRQGAQLGLREIPLDHTGLPLSFNFPTVLKLVRSGF